MGEQVNELKRRLKALGGGPPIAKAVPVWSSSSKGTHSSAIQDVVQQAADELRNANMNSVAPPSVWKPANTCLQGFVFVTGVCVRGPDFVYVQCDVGPEQQTITVQAGCGCGGRYLHSVLLGHLKSSDTNGGASPACFEQFYQSAEQARNKFFAWETHLACGARIKQACKQHKQFQSERKLEAERTRNSIYGQTSAVIENGISVYKMSVDEAQRTVTKLQAELANSATSNRGVKYAKIPNMVLRANGETLPGTSLAHCRIHCTTNKNCKSISFRSSDETCITSSASMMYHSSFNTYLKKRGGIDQPMAARSQFSLIPGMKFESQGSKKGAFYSLEACKMSCLNAPACRGISYSQERKICIRSRTDLQYDDQWDYYEKEASVTEPFDDMEFNEGLVTERKAKASQELGVLQNLVKYKREAEEIDVKKLAWTQQLPPKDAEDKALHEKGLREQSVAIPMP